MTQLKAKQNKHFLTFVNKMVPFVTGIIFAYALGGFGRGLRKADLNNK